MFSNEMWIFLSFYIRSKTSSVPTTDKGAYTSRIQRINRAHIFSIIPLFLNLNKQSFQAESNIKVPVA